MEKIKYYEQMEREYLVFSKEAALTKKQVARMEAVNKKYVSDEAIMKN